MLDYGGVGGLRGVGVRVCLVYDCHLLLFMYEQVRPYTVFVLVLTFCGILEIPLL